MDFNPVCRQDVMPDLLKHVDIDNCTPSTLNVVGKKYEDLTTDPNVGGPPRLEEMEKKIKMEGKGSLF